MNGLVRWRRSGKAIYYARMGKRWSNPGRISDEQSGLREMKILKRLRVAPVSPVSVFWLYNERAYFFISS